tara:strand:- start:3922 stop:6894 length:2973 start_codon:yes stop_codon:yes gene_type:complete
MSNNMESLKLLLLNDKSPIKPKLIKKGNEYTKKFLKWNLQQLKQGKTTLYADKSKYYDPVKKNVKKIPVDKRYKKFTPKPSFLSKNIKVGSTYAPQSFFNNIKNQSQEFSYQLINNNNSYSPDEEIENNILLKVLIDKYSISGNYRIIISGSEDGVLIDNNYNIDNDFWKEHGKDFWKDSENMIWNSDELERPQTITFIFSKETKLNYKFFDQAFLNGVSHCFFTPILNHFENIVEETKAKATKKKYQGLINKIQGKQLKNEFKEGYLHKYANGIKRNDICYVCEDLQIEVAIEQPFNKEPLFEYRSNKKPLKKFKFLNTRSDHVEYATNNDLFKQYEPVKISQKEMIKIKEQLDKDKIFNTYTKNTYGISTLKTLDNYYVLDDEFYEAVKEFEKDNVVLENCSIDALKYPELQSFIDAGTHFNGTIDFVDTDELKKKIPENIKHIDMTKAYTCFEDSKYYNGFMGHITDFREVDNFEEKGLYRITDLNYSKCNEQFVMLNVMLSWFVNDNIYTDAELRALTEQKATFKVTHGAFGTGFDMKLSNDMINKKVLVKQLDSGEDIKIPYYCKYFGMISMTGKTKKFYMDGDQKYFQAMNNVNADIYYENNTAKIVYSKKYCYNKKHITAQITAYQRLIMLEQLLQMDFNKLVRICVDGIYYKDHDIKMHKSFSHKTKMTFKNSPCEEYLSNILKNDNEDNYVVPKAKPRKFYKTELFDGEGGLGKTYYNIFIDKGLIDVCYIPHSWKLSTSQTKQLEREQQEKLQSSVHFHIFNKDIVGYDLLNKYSVILLDECSMLTEKQKQYIIKNTQGKVIFMGDIDMQLAPCEGEQMNRKGIDKITRLQKNWRFKDTKMVELNNLLRKNGDKKYINYFNLGIKTITKDELKKQYKPEDIILNYYKENEYAEMFKDIEKFKITSNTRDYKNGEIVFDKNIKSQKEFRHGYTIHSVQGETFDKNIYIDIRSRKGKVLMQNRLFYTAISRARYFGQLHLII